MLHQRNGMTKIATIHRNLFYELLSIKMQQFYRIHNLSLYQNVALKDNWKNFIDWGSQFNYLKGNELFVIKQFLKRDAQGDISKTRSIKNTRSYITRQNR